MKITAEFNNLVEVKEFIALFGQASASIKIDGAVIAKSIRETFDKGTVDITQNIENSQTEDKQENVPKVEAEIVNVDNESTEPPKDAEVVNEDPKVTKEIVRATFTKLIKAGKQKEAKELTLKYGASKLGEVKEEDYAAIYKDAEELL